MNEDDLRTALQQIAEIASAVSVDREYPGDDETIVCTPRSLPKRLLLKAAEVATAINPVNAPVVWPTADFSAAGVDRAELAVLTSKYWGPTPRRLSVSFMESTPSDLRKRIISHMNAWTRTIGISFVATNGLGDVRISRGAGGYWSYLGTDIRLIPQNRQTMNLQGFTMNTSEAEYKRVVRHETGHTLGFPHEHLRKALVARLDPAKTYAYFWETNRWEKPKVDANVLTPLDERSIMGTLPDQTSIMCYQLPGRITKDGRPIIGGSDINQTDYAFAGRIYPKTVRTPMSEAEESIEDAPTEEDANEWSEAEDVASPITS